MRDLYASRYWILREDADECVVVLSRTDAPFASKSAAALESDRMLPHLLSGRRDYGIVVDVRSAPMRTDPEHEVAFQGLRRTMATRFSRVVVLVSSQVGALQAQRLAREDGTRVLTTMDESAAHELAKESTATESGHRQRATRTATGDAIAESQSWANDLDEWALVREKVLAKLDIRAARRARDLAAELRSTSLELAEVVQDGHARSAEGPELLGALRTLKARAIELMDPSAPSVSPHTPIEPKLASGFRPTYAARADNAAPLDPQRRQK